MSIWVRSRFGGSFTGNFGKGLQCVWVGLLKSGVGYREERADRRLGLVSFVNLVRLDDMRSREIMGDRIWCAEVDFWRVKILVGWGLACDGKKRGYVRFVSVSSHFDESRQFRRQKVDRRSKSGTQSLRLVRGSREIAGGRVGYVTAFWGGFGLLGYICRVKRPFFE